MGATCRRVDLRGEYGFSEAVEQREECNATAPAAGAMAESEERERESEKYGERRTDRVKGVVLWRCHTIEA